MTVLVTGACGFVGQHLIGSLRNYLPSSTPLVATGHSSQDFDAGAASVSWTALDVTDARAVDQLVARIRPTRVIHLAARSSVHQSHGAGRRTFEVNYGGTIALAEAMRRHSPGAVMILASTAEIYGRAFASGLPLTEASPVLPANAYARSKLAAEIALSDTVADVCPVLSLRLCNHTGPGQDERFVVPTFAAQIARIEAGLSPPLLSVGNLTAERDFVDVADVVDAYLVALRQADEAQGFRIYNVGSGTTRTIASILAQLTALSSARFEIAQDPARMRPSDVPRAACDIGAFSAATGWSAKRPWSATLTAVLNYWRDKV